jgi:hypothetical protein
LLARARVLIRIARLVRVTLSETELQTLRPGEFYDVPPSVGRVLVSEGWAIETNGVTCDDWASRANDVPSERATS